jgi:hypothetical protein
MTNSPNKNPKNRQSVVTPVLNRFPPFLMRTLLIFILIALGALVYSNTTDVPFFLDDEGYIKNDAALHISTLSADDLKKALFQSRPRNRWISNLSFALNYYFGGHKLRGYHLVNIAVHLLTGIFLFFLFERTLAKAGLRRPEDAADAHQQGRSQRRYWCLIAFSAALLWLVHPVHTQSVTYIVQRMTSLAAMFYILSLLLYVNGRILLEDRGKSNIIYAAVLFAGCFLSGLLALASKQNAAMLPVFILLYEWTFFPFLRNSWKKYWMVWIFAALLVFACAAVLYLGENPLARILSSYDRRTFTLPQRVMTEFRVVLYYVGLFFYPYPS